MTVDDQQKYDDFASVEVQRKYLAQEEMPEGAYGSAVNKHAPLQGRDYDEGQRHYTPYNYEYKSLHEDIPRQFPNAHKTNDHPDEDVGPSKDNQ
ncbi:cytosolic protein [Salirhabdus salicampi]|uniref:cytosolic protein n=1 Tax=Salirhabdus salicampi TaxID=476102 RepID=UPI0020C43BA4|nr:cytosolic protein [Salirhabdus salicampi]MCP8617750.1 cytosolic protein [Salirhabdus salicampi]